MNPIQILILDSHTNGYEAARRFVRRNGWKLRDCEFILCGSHKNLLERLSQGAYYAVVPVHNSTKGTVSEVVDHLARLRQQGFQIEELARITFRIRHFLMVPSYLNSPQDVETVFSHHQALGQCSGYLDSIGVNAQKRSSKYPSTGASAKHVSQTVRRYKNRNSFKIAAIAPKSAAKAYGLKILAEDVQDRNDNCTTFCLLRNEALVKPKTVGIIGMGKFGKALRTFFESIGCNVIWSDKNEADNMPNKLSNLEVVQKADVIMFAVSIKRTTETIRSLMRYVRPDQLVMDITSVKTNAVKAMMRGKGQVVGLHPMFAPSVAFEGQTIVSCAARLEDEEWKTWVQNMLVRTGCTIKWTDAKTHDTYMATVQSSPQSANLVNAILIMECRVNTSESLMFTSPFYKIMFSLMGRILNQNPTLYAGIFMENAQVPAMLRRRIRIERRLLKYVVEKNYSKFIHWVTQAARYFGRENIRAGNELFEQLLPAMNTFHGSNSVTIEYRTSDDHEGILEQLARVFRRRKVNLKGFHSSNATPGKIRFSVGFHVSKDSQRVRLALDEIEQWDNPRVTIV